MILIIAGAACVLIGLVGLIVTFATTDRNRKKTIDKINSGM